MDAYLAVRCAPEPLLHHAASAVNASIDQCLSVLHALALWYSPEHVKQLLKTVIGPGTISDVFTASSVLFLAEHLYASAGLDGPAIISLKVPDDSSSASSWCFHVDEWSRMHVAITQAEATLDPKLLQHCDVDLFIHCEHARWLF